MKVTVPEEVLAPENVTNLTGTRKVMLPAERLAPVAVKLRTPEIVKETVPLEVDAPEKDMTLVTAKVTFPEEVDAPDAEKGRASAPKKRRRLKFFSPN